MNVFAFTITIDRYVDDLDAIDAFYGKTGDASVAGSDGKTLIYFDREAASLDHALRRAVSDVQREGWQAVEISVEPHCLAAASAG